MMASIAILPPRAANVQAKSFPMATKPCPARASVVPTNTSKLPFPSSASSSRASAHSVRAVSCRAHQKGSKCQGAFFEEVLSTANFEFTDRFEFAVLQKSQEMLHTMSQKDYKNEDPVADLEKVILLIEGQNIFILEDVLAVVKNAAACATRHFRKVSTTLCAIKVLSLLAEPHNEEVAAKIRAATNQVASAFNCAVERDFKAITHDDMVAFFDAAERACPTVSKILIRRRGIAFASRFKQLVSYVGRSGPTRAMSPIQATQLFCTLNKLAGKGLLEANARDMMLLEAKIKDGCNGSTLESMELNAVAFSPKGSSASARHAVTEAANEAEMEKLAYSFAACTVVSFLSAAKYYPSA